MKEQNQRQIQNQTELDERRLRQKKLVRKRKIVLSVMLLTSFLLGCVCGRYFPEIKLGKTEEVLASAQDNSDEEKKENQITNDVGIENEKLTDNAESSEIEEPADSEETNDPFAEIPQVVLSKPVDYSLNQAIRQLEQMEASDERYAQIVENAEKYPEKLLINLANNPEMIAFVADYKGNTRDYDKAELTEKELQEEYPLFLQWDKRWGCLAYGDDSNVAISGCGPTTLAMAVVALTGNEEATPAAIAKFAMQEGLLYVGHRNDVVAYDRRGGSLRCPLRADQYQPD